ncbi:tetratricopeptide repeat protein 19, mitochondrial-like [Amphiura filiformis]|uniref:tetratricopeptide repeat protein 19, mitochondrial-like n=1 Tax=Amphiura filiformis TaxID=82378 RepID=UPI003B22582F
MKGHIDQAEKIMHQALDMALKDKNQQAVTYIYDQMANMLLRQGKFVEAEIAFKETLRRLITSGTEKTDPAVIEISLKLAQIYSATRRISEAQAGFQWCIDTTEKLILSSVTSSSSSSLPSTQERIDVSEKLPLPTVSETTKTESPSSSSSSASTAAEPYDIKDLKALLGMCLEAYARFFAKYKKYDDAIVLFTRALSISENDLMEDGHPHQETVTILNDLGTVYDLKGDYNKAKDCIRRSAQLAQRLGNDHSLPTIVCNMASVEAHSGNYTEAQRLYRKALKQAERQEDSRTVTIIKNKLAQLETDTLLKKK